MSNLSATTPAFYGSGAQQYTNANMAQALLAMQGAAGGGGGDAVLSNLSATTPAFYGSGAQQYTNANMAQALLAMQGAAGGGGGGGGGGAVQSNLRAVAAELTPAAAAVGNRNNVALQRNINNIARSVRNLRNNPFNEMKTRIINSTNARRLMENVEAARRNQSVNLAIAEAVKQNNAARRQEANNVQINKNIAKNIANAEAKNKGAGSRKTRRQNRSRKNRRSTRKSRSNRSSRR